MKPSDTVDTLMGRAATARESGQEIVRHQMVRALDLHGVDETFAIAEEIERGLNEIEDAAVHRAHAEMLKLLGFKNFAEMRAALAGTSRATTTRQRRASTRGKG